MIHLSVAVSQMLHLRKANLLGSSTGDYYNFAFETRKLSVIDFYGGHGCQTVLQACGFPDR